MTFAAVRSGGDSGNTHTSREASLKVRLPLLQVSNNFQLCGPLLGICNLLLHVFVLLDSVCYPSCANDATLLTDWPKLL